MENKDVDPVKIVLAEDDVDDQDIFKDALEETKIPADLTTANNGQELLEKLKDPKIPNPDIIFLDINMPVKNGIESLKEIKKDKELKDIPTVMFSTSTHPNDIEESYKAGANLYVVKPNYFERFVKTLKKVLTLDWKDYLPKPIREKFFMPDKSAF